MEKNEKMVQSVFNTHEKINSILGYKGIDHNE